MSDTPRTTELLTEGCSNKQLVEHAFQLERELADAKLQLEDKTRLLRSIVPHAQDSDSRLSTLRAGVEKLAAEYTRLADTSDDEDFITEKRALARELRALPK